MGEGVIFRSDNLLVRRVPAGASDTVFVSFDPYTEQDSFDRSGFCEHILQSLGIPAVHVLQRRNHWLQHPELPDTLVAIREAVREYRRIVAIGSSLGGFGALTYGVAFGAHVGLALSPQFSVDPRTAPYETRWRHDVAKIRFLKQPVPPSLPLQVIAFDPADAADAKHAALYAERSPTILIPAWYGGHPVGAYLHETGALKLLIESLAAADPDPHFVETITAQFRKQRRRSSQYLYALAQQIPPWRPRSRLAAARLAAETGNPICQSHYAALLDAAGRHDEALPVHRAACAHPDPNPAAYWNLMAHHVALGQDAQAESVGRDGLRRYPRSPQLRRKLRWLVLRRRLSLGRLFPAFGLRALQRGMERR